MEHMRRMLETCSPVTDSLFARYDAVDTASTIAPDSVVTLKRGLELAWMASVSPQWCAPLFARFRRNGTWQVPTLAVLWPYAFLADSGAAYPLEYVPANERTHWATQLRDRTPAEYRFSQEMFARRLDLVHAMARAGVGLLAGSDPMNEYVVAGFGLHHELRLFTQAGLSPLEALQTATIGPARFLQREHESGSIAPGKLADLVLLDADPLADIRNTERISAVVLHGRLLRRPALDSLLQRAAAAVR